METVFGVFAPKECYDWNETAGQLTREHEHSPIVPAHR